MISLQKRFLFVHIPKTAGNSIQSVLRGYSEDQLVALRKEQDGIERFGLRNPNYKIKKHSMLSEYRDALEDEQFRNLYKFTCVRNPWDRMVSYYFTPTQNPETWDRKKFRGIISKAVSVADYLRLENGEEDPVRQYRSHHAIRKSCRRFSSCVHGHWHFAINPAAIQPLKSRALFKILR